MAQQRLAYLEGCSLHPINKPSATWILTGSARTPFPSSDWGNELLSHRLHFPEVWASPSSRSILWSPHHIPGWQTLLLYFCGDCGRCLSTKPLSFESHTPAALEIKTASFTQTERSVTQLEGL